MFDLNKKNWPEYQFSEIAEQISERIDPAESDAEIYVGLEHIEPDSIHIREHGKPSDVKGTKLKIYKGDIVFGKRRAYQRKAAIADFDGICSAHAMVLRTKPKVMIPELFPFFLHSDAFMNRAIDISEGSLSPTIKWKILAKQKFVIPPLDEQKKLANLLWAGDELLQKYYQKYLNLSIYFDSLVNELIWNGDFQEDQIKNITENNQFRDGDWIESKDMDEQGSIRLLQLADIGENKFLDKSEKFINEKKFTELDCFEVLEGDLLLARMPDPIGRACLIPKLTNKLITAVDCCVIRVDTTKHNKHYWLYLINSMRFRRRIEALSSGTTRLRISRTNLEKIKAPFRNIQQQNIISEKLLNTQKVIQKIEKQIIRTKKIIKVVNLELFS